MGRTFVDWDFNCPRSESLHSRIVDFWAAARRAHDAGLPVSSWRPESVPPAFPSG
jgi:hypothetical protein